MEIEELEIILSTYKITKPKYKGEEVGNESLPFMLTTFRKLILEGVPPTQEEFINEFRSTYPNLKMKGIVSRLKRAYLSYVREYHLGYLLKNHFKKVIYDEKLDIAGVDYVVYYHGYKFNLHAFVNTANGKYWRGIKEGRHNFRGRHLDVPIDLDKGKRCGKIILYTDNNIYSLKLKMDKNIKDERSVQKGVHKPIRKMPKLRAKAKQ